MCLVSATQHTYMHIHVSISVSIIKRKNGGRNEGNISRAFDGFEFISDSDVSFVSLLLLIFFIYSMPHNLHGNILRKCLEAENGSA